MITYKGFEDITQHYFKKKLIGLIPSSSKRIEPHQIYLIAHKMAQQRPARILPQNKQVNGLSFHRIPSAQQ